MGRLVLEIRSGFNRRNSDGLRRLSCCIGFCNLASNLECVKDPDLDRSGCMERFVRCGMAGAWVPRRQVDLS